MKRERRKARLVYREDLSSTLAIFRFEPEGGVPDFEAGQFLTLGIRLASGGTLWRAYSIASPPEEKSYVELYVRWAQVPVRGRFTTELWDMKLGDEIFWKPPKGKFTIAEHGPDGSPEKRRLLLVAGGTGLAPFISYVLHMRHIESRREVVLCHGASHVEELGYRELLLGLERQSRAEPGSWNFRYLPTISRPADEKNAGWKGHTGRVETLLIRPEGNGSSPVEKEIGKTVDPSNTCSYICGFEGTVTSVLAVAEPVGFRTERDPRPDGSYDVRFESYG